MNTTPRFFFVFYLRREGQVSVPPPPQLEGPTNTRRLGAFGAGTAELDTVYPLTPFFQPARKRSMYVMDSRTALPDPETLFKVVMGHREPNLQAEGIDGLSYAELVNPFPAFCIQARNVPMACLGVYTESYDALVITDIANYRSVLHTSAQARERRKPFVYGIDLGMTFSVYLNVQRLCSRWARWAKESGTANSAHRFILLEHYLRNLNSSFSLDDKP